MQLDVRCQIDQTDWKILELLQADGRLSFSELGRQVSMSAPAVTERVRRLEEMGVITGYRAVVDHERLGASIQAIIRVRTDRQNHDEAFEAMADRPEVRWCHVVTGDDCLVVKVACPDISALEEATGFLARFGSTTTSVVFSTPIADAPVTPELVT
ncbi:MAG: Lrp/AsnC family transcriptional regulator [Acidimicrobiales bacterium]